MTDAKELFKAGELLSCLIEGVNKDVKESASEAPHLVRKRLEQIVSTPTFLNDCVEVLFSQLVTDPGSRVLFSDPSLRYSLQVFVWPPGFENEPHLHKTWTVSAMLQNSLVVFRSKISEAECLKSQPLSVFAGQVGVLIPPQFHCFRNEGSDAAVSFHVFSRDHNPRGESPQTVLEDPPQTFDDDDIFAIARMAATSQDKRSAKLIRMAFTLVEVPTKLRIVKLMAKIDPDQAVCLGNLLCELIGEEDAIRLRRALGTFQCAR
jgi:predicted metal-dependent enzyme (double-stranded beta helix superfamily)